MSVGSKITRSGGLTLGPQHFQRQDLYHETRLQRIATALSPHFNAVMEPFAKARGRAILHVAPLLNKSVGAFGLLALFGHQAAASSCYGTVGSGHLAGGVQLPSSGPNFVAYSRLGVKLGRTYVHDVVRDVVVDAYASLEQAAPGKTYVYGETGLIHGGPIRPHRTHQAGLSVDFMVPVLDSFGRSVPLPTSPLNKFGYGLDFDDQGRIPGMRIDFEAMAEHLYQIYGVARRHGATIQLVIFDPPLMEKLFTTRRGPFLRSTLPFMKGRPWIRHDEHYHVDFSLPCLPPSAYRATQTTG